MTINYIFDKIVDEWGMPKTVQLILLSISAAGVTFVIGANLLPNKSKAIEKGE